MLKTCISFLTRNQVELTKQTLPKLNTGEFDLYWIDGSTDEEAQALISASPIGHCYTFVRGGADAAICFALTQMLSSPANYTHVGLCESDVLLADGWFAKTMELFGRGRQDGLEVGAVSARAYEDRVLIQRDGYGVMLNLGAGHVIFTRAAAELVLKFYRTGWWHDTRAVFAQLSGIDIGRFAAFRGNEQWTSCDWGWDAVLAQHGLASLALTPCTVDMIGQEPPLEEQGLTLAREPVEERRDDEAFVRFYQRTRRIRNDVWKPDAISPAHRHMGIQTIFAHQLSYAEFEGDWRLKWSQGFGPFAWRASEDGCRLQLPLFGPATFLVSGGTKGAKVSITDTESGYEITPDIPPSEMQIAQLQMPAGMSYREIVMTCSEGAIFYGVQTTEPQPITNQKFDYHSLPPV